MPEDNDELLEKLKKETDLLTRSRLVYFLRKKKDIPLGKIAAFLGVKPSYLAHILRLNRLPEVVIDGYYSHVISQSHLFSISRLKDHTDMMQAYEKVLSENLNVSQTDDLVRESLYDVSSFGTNITEEEENKLISFFKRLDTDVNVKIIQTRIKTKMILELKGNLKKTTLLMKKLIAELT